MYTEAAINYIVPSTVTSVPASPETVTASLLSGSTGKLTCTLTCTLIAYYIHQEGYVLLVCAFV